jgi:hypothetical protein
MRVFSTLHQESKSGVTGFIINIFLKHFTSKYQYGQKFIAVCIFNNQVYVFCIFLISMFIFRCIYKIVKKQLLAMSCLSTCVEQLSSHWTNFRDI